MDTTNIIITSHALALTLFASTVTFAAGDQKARCTLRATEAIPRVAGLKVVKSGTRPMPPEQLANWKGQSVPIVVDIDTNAPGGAQRYSYVCANAPTGQAFVQRIATPDLSR